MSVSLRKAIWWAWPPSSPADRLSSFLVKEHSLQKHRLHVLCSSQLQEKQVNQNSQLSLSPYGLKGHYGPDSLLSSLLSHCMQLKPVARCNAESSPSLVSSALHTCGALHAPKSGAQPFLSKPRLCHTDIPAGWQRSAGLEQDCLRVEE